MKTHALISVSLLMAAALIQPALAQVIPLDGGVEGPISAITRTRNVVTMTVAGALVRIPPRTPITSPTKRLTPAQLVSRVPFPGRTEPGFIGGTAIVTGTVDAAGTITATDVSVLPAENVVLGTVTSNVNGVLSVNGTPIKFLRDPRIPSSPLRDINGFSIILSSVVPGSLANVEGYFANGTFYAHLVEIDGPAQRVSRLPQTSITLAQVREQTPNNLVGDQVEMRGAVTTAHVLPGVTTQTVRILRIDRGVARFLGLVTAVIDPAVPGVAEWRFRTTTLPSNNRILGSAPTVVRAVNISPGARNARAQQRTVLLP